VSRVALDILTDPPSPPADERFAYGSEPLQFADLRRADGDTLAVVVHGGAWKATYNLTYTAHLCVDLRRAGISTLNVEYRRVGDPGGTWPGAFEDVVRAAERARSFASELVLVGHSAGAQLALLAGARLGIPVVGIASICDPASWDNPAVGAFFGGPPPVEASPFHSLPLGVRHVLVHGTEDEVVPFEQSRRHAEAAGAEAELLPLEGAGHFEPVDPLSPEWTVVRAAIERMLG
jgi:acetyl esterase/lipase